MSSPNHLPPLKALKPKFRGVSHQWAALVAVAAAIWLVQSAPSSSARWASAVYGISMIGLFTVSAIYHRHNWVKESTRAMMRKLDHSMIFVMIAGTVTPIAALVLEGNLRTAVLSVAWGVTAVGILIKLLWIGAPKWISASIYTGMAWAGVVVAPKLFGELGWWPLIGLLGGGIAFSIGAVIYARQKPDPNPRIFGYHEIFHLLVIVGAILHFLVVAFAVVPNA